MNIRKIDDRFAVTGQIQPGDISALAAAGFSGIICARPDDEDAGQPSFEQIEKAARQAGITAVHIPVSGPLTEGQMIRFEQALETMDGPVLGYCRSGGRAGSLYQACKK
ncbi:MAG: hypothetical protein JWP99_1114 [Devosia sp.]|nr:hypothetical protein [Devosia sp.]